MEESDKERSEESAEKEAENTEKVGKKHKKRQKKLLSDLQKQIEFYFSEPNLQKDRFLRKEIAESDNGCVKIETIASFNRMKQLCGDISLIVKAMKLCPSVEVIDDKWVKPSKPLSEQKNVDPVTIYVERLPSNADHDWVKSMFSSCGKVVYVSLPRYKTTRDIKGFAFVEFEKESEAKAALEMFAAKPNTVEEVETENKTENSEELAGKQNKKNKKRKAKISESENEDAKSKSKKAKRKKEDGTSTSSIPDINLDTDKEESKKNKRNTEKEDFDETSPKKAKKCEDNEEKLTGNDDTSEETKSKKRKRERSAAIEDGSTSSKKNKESQESDEEGCTSSKKSKDACETSAQDGVGEVDDEDLEDKKRKKRKRKKKEKEKQEVEAPQLRVISKTEWLSLKKEYQKLQREAMKDAKAKLKIEFEAKTENVASKANETSEDVKADNTPSVEIKTASTEKKEPLQKLEMQPGVVLRFSIEENIDNRQLRNLFSTIAPVAYLDKDDDKNMGHVRFETKEACDKVVGTFSTGSMENIKIEILTEKEDVEYWERLNKDRLERCQGTKHKRNKRGRQKITKKMDERAARKRDHVHFDE